MQRQQEQNRCLHKIVASAIFVIREFGVKLVTRLGNEASRSMRTDFVLDVLEQALYARQAYSQLKSLFYGSENPNATPNKLITVEFVK